MAVIVRPVAGGCRVALRVKPGARRQRLVGAHGDRLKLEVTAAPEKGKANVAVERLIAGELGLAARHVRVVIGHTSQDKVVEITGSDAAEVAGALAKLGIEADR